MTLVTKSHFARLAGVTPQAVDDRIKKGQIFTIGEGRKSKIDLDSIEAKSYIEDNRNANKEKNMESPREKPQQTIKPEPKKKKPAGKVTTIREKKNIDAYYQGEMDLDGLPADLAFLSKHDLDRTKLAVMIQKEKINADKARGQLIDRSIIFAAFSKLYEIDNTQFLQLSARLTSSICNGIFETEDPEKIVKVTELIDDELYKVQNHIQIKMNKFLENLKLEKINISGEDRGE